MQKHVVDLARDCVNLCTIYRCLGTHEPQRWEEDLLISCVDTLLTESL